MPPSPEEPVTVIVAVADHTRRRAWSAALSAAGFAPRPVSRPAELAKALADGEARLAVAVAGEDALPLTGAERVPVPRFAADVSMAALVAGVRDALAAPPGASMPTRRRP